mmetsp:Transcript_6228/g.11137  ORF Transcript_6228/g.11137 Transcript_6228/m.11137 type:complete len:97 (-) Transcript_6228:258-548(-)
MRATPEAALADKDIPFFVEAGFRGAEVAEGGKAGGGAKAGFGFVEMAGPEVDAVSADSFSIVSFGGGFFVCFHGAAGAEEFDEGSLVGAGVAAAEI